VSNVSLFKMLRLNPLQIEKLPTLPAQELMKRKRPKIINFWQDGVATATATRFERDKRDRHPNRQKQGTLSR
jgi:hypothetical protein